ncbi:DUF2442 domain-containing protein [Aliamphritea hakodatensis]|uniref:DUF2442 domain-containing protein n=1 Tax=Aliamphritea hakodatensis TaxID=2895352 RepID=UPI0022FD419F|nr:DUF2442 domain-containing protein [Aliamphritea hakodatensis]
MNPEVIDVFPIDNYRLRIVFSDNAVKEFDVSPYLDKGVFRALNNREYFARARVAFGAVEWPDGQDFSKDTLYLNSVKLSG